ncbi:MAG: hypothetical protein IJ357_02130 [Oscillospiraceae bacterium]|nr:hypothetical protein [Oscillospiraceae bacterium]
MNLLTVLLDAASKGEIPARPATVMESLKLMGLGWGCIFIVIAVIAVVTIVLNRVCRDKK